MTDLSDPADDKFCLVDVVHEWLGQAGLRKKWGIAPMNYPDFGNGPDSTVKIADIFLRAPEPKGRWQGVPYFTVWPYRVEDKGGYGPNKFSVSAYDPEFFVKLRKMLDYREHSNTIVCRCSQCEGVKNEL
jgi:hypothetical protein